jgi:hypothetical protein
VHVVAAVGAEESVAREADGDGLSSSQTCFRMLVEPTMASRRSVKRPVMVTILASE